MPLFETFLAIAMILVLMFQVALVVILLRSGARSANGDDLAILNLSLGSVRDAVASNFEHLGRSLREATEDGRAMQLERLAGLSAALSEGRTASLAENKALREELLGSFDRLSGAVVARVADHAEQQGKTLAGFGDTLELHRKQANEAAAGLRGEGQLRDTRQQRGIGEAGEDREQHQHHKRRADG